MPSRRYQLSHLVHYPTKKPLTPQRGTLELPYGQSLDDDLFVHARILAMLVANVGVVLVIKFRVPLRNMSLFGE